LLPRAIEIDLRSLQCRGQAEDQARQTRDQQRIAQDWKVEMQIGHQRKIVGNQLPEETECPGSQQQTKASTGGRKQEALGNQLPDDPPATGSQRCSDCYLTPSRGSVGKEQVCNVGAGNEANQ